MFPGESGFLIEYMRLSRNFSPAIYADSNHQLILVRLLGVRNPTIKRIKVTIVFKSSA